MLSLLFILIKDVFSLSCASRMRVASHDRVWKLLPASDITFHNVRNHKAVYTQRCLLIWFMVCLLLYSLTILSKSPRQLSSFFHEETRSCPLLNMHFCEAYGSLGANGQNENCLLSNTHLSKKTPVKQDH